MKLAERITDPNRHEHYVYRLVNKRGDTLYIGCTQNIEQRLGEHRRHGAHGHLWTSAVLDGPYNRQTARRIEHEAITTEKPPFNCEWTRYLSFEERILLTRRAKRRSA